MDYEFIRHIFTPEFISRWDKDRSKEAMKLGNFLLFSYAERLNGDFVSHTNTPLDNWHSFLGAIQVLTDKDKEVNEIGDTQIFSNLMAEVGHELSFFVNGVDFDTDLLPEMYGLLNPDHVLPEEFCYHCLEPNVFKSEFDLFSHWRSGKFTGIQDSQILDALAASWGNLEGAFGYVLAGNPYCSEALLSKLLTSKYISPVYDFFEASTGVSVANKSTRGRAELNVKIKEHFYFQNS